MELQRNIFFALGVVLMQSLGLGLALYIAAQKTVIFSKIKLINSCLIVIFVMTCICVWTYIFDGDYSMLIRLNVYLILLRLYMKLLETRVVEHEKLKNMKLITFLIMVSNLVCMMLLIGLNIENGIVLESNMSIIIVSTLIMLGLVMPKLFIDPKFVVYTYIFTVFSCSVFLLINKIGIFSIFSVIALILFEISCIQGKKANSEKTKIVERFLGIFILVCFVITLTKEQLFGIPLLYILFLFTPYKRNRYSDEMVPSWFMRHIVQIEKMFLRNIDHINSVNKNNTDHIAVVNKNNEVRSEYRETLNNFTDGLSFVWNVSNLEKTIYLFISESCEIDWGDGIVQRIDVYNQQLSYKGLCRASLSADEENFVLNEIENKGIKLTHKYEKRKPYFVSINSKRVRAFLAYRQEIVALNIQEMKDMEYLSLDFNCLSQIDLTSNINLKFISCCETNINEIDVSKNLELRYLDCSDNDLGNINIENNLKLEELLCSGCNLTTLDISNNTQLNAVLCTFNNISELNCDNNPKLSYLEIGDTQIKKIDITNTQINDFYFALYMNEIIMTTLQKMEYDRYFNNTKREFNVKVVVKDEV